MADSACCVHVCILAVFPLTMMPSLLLSLHKEKGSSMSRWLLQQSRLLSRRQQPTWSGRFLSTSSRFPDHADVVIVGGGVIGTSVAYHVAKLWPHKNIVVLERHELTSGTTWHAAGLMTSFGSLSATSTAIRQYTRQLYADILPRETGLETGFMDVGFIELACDPDRLHYFRRVAAFNRFCGINVQEISPAQVQALAPWIRNKNDILAGFYVPADGRVNPTDVTRALAKGARQRGVQIVEHAAVQSISTTTPTDSGVPSKVDSVHVLDTLSNTKHTITTDIVVNCAGLWARQLGAQNGLILPNQAVEHYYLITDEIPGLDPLSPVVEDPSLCIYARPEGNGIMIGFFEWEGAPWNLYDSPNDTPPFLQLEPDWDRMTPYLQQALEQRFAPEIQTAGIKTFFCGPESFTPDGNPMVGPVPTIQNYFVAAGLNSIGILTGGGIGKVLAEWMVRDGIAPVTVDVTPIHVNRFHARQMNQAYRAKRAGETLGDTYRLVYPQHSPTTGRNVQRSPLHDRLLDQKAYFKDVSGWESPAWYGVDMPEGVPLAQASASTGSFFANNNNVWFDAWKAEHMACRTGVALFDMSFMSKFLVCGRDAGSLLNRLSTANVNGPVGTITYTQWLNEEGYLEADLTVTKLTDDQFLVIATDTMHSHVQAHLQRRIRSDQQHVFLHDVTGQYAQINLQGPNSRELLQRLTPTTDLSNQAYPFGTAREIEVALARAYCARITYCGELGYELWIPVEQAAYVYDTILQHVQPSDHFRHAGLQALNSLRLEKAYRDYGHDIDNTDTLVEAGLSFTCDFSKPIPFVGQEHVERQIQQRKERGGLSKRLAQVVVPTLDPEHGGDALLYHGEVLWRNGIPISELRVGSYGHSLQAGVGLTMLERQDDGVVDKEWIDHGEWELEVADQRYPCNIHLRPAYDPTNARIKI